MPSVQKRKSKWFAVLWNRVEKKQKWVALPKTVTGKREAVKAAAVLQDRLDRELLGLEVTRTDGERAWLNVAEEVVNEIEASAGKDWFSACNQFVERFLDYVGDCPLSEITRQNCRSYLSNRISEGANKSTLRKEISFLRRIFRRAVENEDILKNPWDGIRGPAEPKHAPAFLTEDEFAKLLAVAPTERRLRYLLLAHTGARKSEVQRICWREIDLKSNQVRITNAAKGLGTKQPVRTVPLSRELKAVLIPLKGKPGEKILKHTRNWNRDLGVDVKKSGIRQTRIHDLRHTYGSWLCQSGIPLRRIQKLMGHESITTTERYAHLAPSTDEDIASILDEKYRQSIDINKPAVVLGIS